MSSAVAVAVAMSGLVTWEGRSGTAAGHSARELVVLSLDGGSLGEAAAAVHAGIRTDGRSDTGAS